MTFAAVLQNSNTSITPNRYLRLMALAITEIIWQIILTVLPMYDNIAPGLRPWTTWADVHSDWLRVDQYYLAEFLPAYKNQMFLFFFAIPASSLLFFIFFGFGEQAVSDYRALFDWVRRKVFRQKPSAQKMPKNGMMLRYESVLAYSSAHRLTRRVRYSSAGNVSARSAYSIPNFVVASDGNSLPAYSPPSDRAVFHPSIKSESKKELDDFDFSDSSLHNVAIATLSSGEYSPTDTESSTGSHFPAASREADEHFVGAPIVASQNALESPTGVRPGGLPVPPRAATQVSRFSRDSDIADMA